MRRPVAAAAVAWLGVVGFAAVTLGGPTVRGMMAPRTPACDRPAQLVVNRLPPGEPYTDPTQQSNPVMVEGSVHPVTAAQAGLAFLAAGDQAGARRMLDLEAPVDGLLPYRFDFPSFGMHAPWYSAMAQGQVLSLAVRLGDRAMVDLILPSITGPSPVARQTTTGLWLEEYPTDPPDPVLNGAIYAAYGLYDEWAATGSAQAHDALVASLSAIRADLTGFRQPGATPWYDLGHTREITAEYSPIYLAQMATLATMTGDACFAQMGAAFAFDMG